MGYTSSPTEVGLNIYHSLVGFRLNISDQLKDETVDDQTKSVIELELIDIAEAERQLRDLVPDLDQRETDYQSELEGIRAQFRI